MSDSKQQSQQPENSDETASAGENFRSDEIAEEQAANGESGSHHGGDHQKHHEHMLKDFRRRFWVSLVLTILVLALSKMIQGWVGLEDALAFPGAPYVQFGFATALFFYGGWPFLKRFYQELRNSTEITSSV